MWTRQALVSNFLQLKTEYLTVTNTLKTLLLEVTGVSIFRKSIEVDSAIFTDTDLPGIRWYGEPPTTRVTQLLQCEPAYQNNWTTDVTTGPDRLTFAIDPTGHVDVHGMIRTSVLASRNSGTIVGNLNANAYTKGFIPLLNIHVVLDGRTVAGFTPVVVIEANTGLIRCYSIDNVTSGAQSWYISTSYNVFTTRGKYYNTGGGPY